MKQFKMEIVNRCCRREMKKISNSISLNIEINEEMMYICLNCGLINIVKLGQSLDDEELANILETFADKEIRNSKIFRELKKEGLIE